MTQSIRNTAGLVLFLSILTAVTLFTPMESRAQPPCIAFICKSAPELPVPDRGEERVFFPFIVDIGNGPVPVQIPANVDLCFPAAFDSSDGAEIFEESTPGWILTDIECSDAPGIGVTIFNDGVELECISEGAIFCTFTNVRGANPIPTLSEWGMIAAAAGLALVGVFFAVRRRKAFNT